MSKTLRLILGDQLNYKHSWFRKIEENVAYVLMEIEPEARYVRHHIQKLVGFFGAMRAFTEHLRKQGHQVFYIQLDEPENQQDFAENLKIIIKAHSFQKLEYLLPDEYRLDQALSGLEEQLGLPVRVYDTEHFLTERMEVAQFFAKKKSYLLESFYRYMRKKHNILMDGKEPISGRWNFDAENRQKYDPKVAVPPLPQVEYSVVKLHKMIERKNLPYLGRLNPEKFIWPLTREDALKILHHFVENCLAYFGRFQDAMDNEEVFLFHSRLSFALNVKMIHPLEVCEQVISYWEEHPQKVDLAQVEGFVRQVLGWREFMRGVYWAYMPSYAEKNYFEHHRKLPKFFWTGNTKMNCLQKAIGQSLDHAYAHHIQRLMVTGNFALLAQVAPDEVDLWYLGIYIDAIEWVEITNTRGMSQFADGGIVGTKPYISSANYIDKMGNHCRSCSYDKKKKYGEMACPFNSLYWYFYETHREKLSKNPRVGMMYRTWDRMKADEKEKIIKQAQAYLEGIDEL